jgi:hypothetical protein
MRLFRYVISSVGLAFASSIWAAETVSVAFIQPQRFTDAGFTNYEVETNLRKIARHLQWLGAKRLGASEMLAVEVTDVDLAGKWDPGVAPAGMKMRIVKEDVNFPSIALRYRLLVDGRPVAQGEQVISDPVFLRRLNPYASDDQLRYEKKLLDDWFETRIVERSSAKRSPEAAD